MDDDEVLDFDLSLSELEGLGHTVATKATDGCVFRKIPTIFRSSGDKSFSSSDEGTENDDLAFKRDTREPILPVCEGGTNACLRL